LIFVVEVVVVVIIVIVVVVVVVAIAIAIELDPVIFIVRMKVQFPTKCIAYATEQSVT
jgi:hypothetical protein